MLAKGIFIILKANVFSLVFSLLTSFLLPGYLTVEAYAAIKTFQMYSTYVGVLHLGFADGMYLRYGGVPAAAIDRQALSSDAMTMRLFQLFMTGAAAAVSVVLRDGILLAVAVSVLPMNMAAYYKLLFQATGEFARYGRIMNLTTVLTFLVNMTALFLLRLRGSGAPYIAGYAGVNLLVWLLLEHRFHRFLGPAARQGRVRPAILVRNIRDGILLMLGNFSAALLAGMGRWFIKVWMPTLAFAQYSFAVSVESFLNLAVTPVAVTLYHYFCSHKALPQIRKAQSTVILFSGVLPAGVFPVRWILQQYLPNYKNAGAVLVFLFAAQIFSSIIKCVYINVYKARHRQRQYFGKLALVILAAFALHLLCFWLYPCKEAFAAAALLSQMVWFALCLKDFPDLRPAGRELGYLLFACTAFLLTGTACAPVTGLIAYSLAVALAAAVLLRSTVLALLHRIQILRHAGARK